jgi:hypothetical protein
MKFFSTFLCCVLATFVAGCSGHKSPLAPDNSAITAQSPKIKLSIGHPLHSEAGRCFASGTLSGTGGSDDLIRGLPVTRGVNLAAGESWTGSWLRVVDWGYNKFGAGVQTGIPFVPGTFDHFQFDDIPFDCATGPDWTFQIVFGGNTMPDPTDATHNRVIMKPGAELVPVQLNADNVIVETISGVQPTFTGPDAKGVIHMKMDRSPY